MRGTCRGGEGSFNGDSVKHVMEGCGNGAFLYRALQEEPRALG